MADLTKWEVRIQFTDGRQHTNCATASTKLSAFRLVLQDAYMLSPFFTFKAPVQSWEATVVEEVAA
jgi:hypothetical protein